MPGVVRWVFEIDGWNHDPADRVLALTFDDGPGPSTGAVLDVLAENGVHATFFMPGQRVESHPDDVVRVSAEGHTIGTHTWSHTRPDELGDAGILAETTRSNELVHSLTGRAVRLVRPPYRPEYASQFDRVLGPLGISTVVWSVDSRDWEQPGPQAIADSVLTELHPGAIVVLHDGGQERPATVAALPAIIAGALGRGYRFVAL